MLIANVKKKNIKKRCFNGVNVKIIYRLTCDNAIDNGVKFVA